MQDTQKTYSPVHMAQLVVVHLCRERVLGGSPVREGQGGVPWDMAGILGGGNAVMQPILEGTPHSADAGSGARAAVPTAAAAAAAGAAAATAAGASSIGASGNQQARLAALQEASAATGGSPVRGSGTAASGGQPDMSRGTDAPQGAEVSGAGGSGWRQPASAQQQQQSGPETSSQAGGGSSDGATGGDTAKVRFAGLSPGDGGPSRFAEDRGGIFPADAGTVATGQGGSSSLLASPVETMHSGPAGDDRGSELGGGVSAEPSFTQLARPTTAAATRAAGFGSYQDLPAGRAAAPGPTPAEFSFLAGARDLQPLATPVTSIGGRSGAKRNGKRKAAAAPGAGLLSPAKPDAIAIVPSDANMVSSHLMV